MNDDGIDWRLRAETKRALMQAVRHYTQKTINSDRAADRLNRAKMSRPALVPQAAELLEAAREVEEEAYDALVAAADRAIEAGWSTEDRVFFTQEAQDQVRAADAAGGGGGAQGGGRRKTRAARMRSKRRKSFTRKQKHKRRA